MASNINSVSLSGRIVAAPELKRIGDNSTPLATFAVAVRRTRRDGDGWKDETHFVECKAWGGMAENAARKLDKGSFVFLSGRIEQERWETNGQNRSRLVIVAETLEGEAFFKKADDSEGGTTQPSQSSPVAEAAPKAAARSRRKTS